MDRNILSKSAIVDLLTSLSARRAWIEIVAACPFSCCGTVALRKESVDRNLMWYQCNTVVKENTAAITEMRVALDDIKKG